jgi:hypothetical protein
MTSYTAELDPRRWIQDRQNFVSLYHDDTSLILGGGNTKLQPLWSTFTVGDIKLLKHKPGDENPNFLPPPGLKHTPSSAALMWTTTRSISTTAASRCSVAVDLNDAEAREGHLHAARADHAPCRRACAAHPELKGKWATASGRSGTLSDDAIDLKAGEAGEWFAHRGFRIGIPKDATIAWPALPHNPYVKDGKAEPREGRIIVTLTFSADVTRQEITVELDEGTK